LFASNNYEICRARFARNEAIGVIRNSSPLHVLHLLGGRAKLLSHLGEEIHHLLSLTIIGLSIDCQKGRQVRPSRNSDQQGTKALRQVDGKPDSPSVNSSCADMHHEGGVRHRFSSAFQCETIGHCGTQAGRAYFFGTLGEEYA